MVLLLPHLCGGFRWTWRTTRPRPPSRSPYLLMWTTARQTGRAPDLGNTTFWITSSCFLSSSQASSRAIRSNTTSSFGSCDAGVSSSRPRRAGDPPSRSSGSRTRGSTRRTTRRSRKRSLLRRRRRASRRTCRRRSRCGGGSCGSGWSTARRWPTRGAFGWRPRPWRPRPGRASSTPGGPRKSASPAWLGAPSWRRRSCASARRLSPRNGRAAAGTLRAPCGSSGRADSAWSARRRKARPRSIVARSLRAPRRRGGRRRTP
mmetsp:Transcript_15138/g.53147  ORF Transcript_15138/g.53147 Transcript_15138/m.53147 type:complete len:261 (-) Transcript_15138:227-1009(-)